MTAERTLLTADELFRMPDDGMRHELVKGEVRTLAPAGGAHGVTAAELARFLGNFVRPRDLGYVFAAETGFWVERAPDTVRAPDVAFVAADRLPEKGLRTTFPDLAPDIVAEVVSPSDTAKQVEEKVQEWLRAGVRLAWVVYPATMSVTVYSSDGDIKVLKENDTLEGGDVLPGFRCRVRDLFPF